MDTKDGVTPDSEDSSLTPKDRGVNNCLMFVVLLNSSILGEFG